MGLLYNELIKTKKRPSQRKPTTEMGLFTAIAKLELGEEVATPEWLAAAFGQRHIIADTVDKQELGFDKLEESIKGLGDIDIEDDEIAEQIRHLREAAQRKVDKVKKSTDAIRAFGEEFVTKATSRDVEADPPQPPRQRIYRPILDGSGYTQIEAKELATSSGHLAKYMLENRWRGKSIFAAASNDVLSKSWGPRTGYNDFSAMLCVLRTFCKLHTQNTGELCHFDFTEILMEPAM